MTFAECKHCWLGYRADLPMRNLEALKQLRKEGYRLILLSNTNPFMMDWAESEEFDGMGHSIHHYFDATYMSYRVKTLKPSEYFFSEEWTAEVAHYVDDHIERFGRIE